MYPLLDPKTKQVWWIPGPPSLKIITKTLENGLISTSGPECCEIPISITFSSLTDLNCTAFVTLVLWKREIHSTRAPKLISAHFLVFLLFIFKEGGPGIHQTCLVFGSSIRNFVIHNENWKSFFLKKLTEKSVYDDRIILKEIVEFF